MRDTTGFMLGWAVLRNDRNPELFGFALGLWATLAQVALMREALTLAGGNELAVGLGLGSWLACVGLGALIGAPFPGSSATMLTASLSAGPLAVVGLLLLRLNRIVLDLSPGDQPTLSAIALVLAGGLGLGGLTVGFSFSVAARALSSSSPEPVSRLYTFEAIGALVAGVLYTFVLAGTATPLTVLSAGAAVLAAGGAALSQTRIQIGIGVTTALVLATASLLLLPAFDRETQRWAFERLGAGELMITAESEYGRIALGHSTGQYQLLTDGHVDYAFPNPWERTPTIHIALSQHPRPLDVLLIGGGVPDVIEAVLAHRPRRVVITYLDELEHELLGPFWPRSTAKAMQDPAVEVVRNDGRRFVTRTKNRFDVVIISAKPPLSGQANRYYTREFYTAVASILRPGGSMTALAPGGDNLLAPEAARATASIVATVGSIFPEIALIPGLKVGVHAATRPGVVSENPVLLASRFDKRAIKAPEFTGRRFSTLLEPTRLASLRSQLANWPTAINTDLEPQAYLANLQLWERSLTERGETSRPTWTGYAERWAWLWLVGPLALWAVWRGVRLIRGQHHPAPDAVFAISTTGAAGMAVEVMVLYTFQAASGRLYTGLALLVAAFMVGLAGGAWAGRKILKRLPRARGIGSDAAALILMLTTGPILSGAIELPGLALAWSSVAGIVTGAAFPALLAVAATAEGGDEGRAAAKIEAADHLGAALGALITGVLWLPVYGITPSCLMFAALKAASLVGMIPSIGKRGRLV